MIWIYPHPERRFGMIDGKPVIAVSNNAQARGEANDESRLITCSSYYIKAVALSGAIPALTCEEAPGVMARLCDALLLTGGNDIDPRLYGQEILFDSVKTDKARTDFEFELARAFVCARKPIMGICRGCQLLNVLFGGTLYQDLPGQLRVSHQGVNLRHEVIAEPGSVLYGLYGERLIVNSSHHQSVRALGDGLTATAHTPGDGVVEAFEHGTLPIWGYQFHPERMIGLISDDGSPDFLSLFMDFADRASDGGNISI
jgi:putative glutamine amidotransferase